MSKNFVKTGDKVMSLLATTKAKPQKSSKLKMAKLTLMVSKFANAT